MLLSKTTPFELIKSIRICSIKIGLASYLIMNLNQKVCKYLKMNNKKVRNECLWVLFFVHAYVPDTRNTEQIFLCSFMFIKDFLLG